MVEGMPLLLLVAVILAAAVMAGVWFVAMRIRNAGIVDVAWAGTFGVLAAIYALAGRGYGPRKILICSMMILWSLRLTAYLYRRVAGMHPEEDGRYQQLREAWSKNLGARLFWFFQLQGLLNVLLSVPVLLACLNPELGLRWLEWVGAGIWVIAVAGESLADRQLERFKADPRNRGSVCQSGLWYYSRHPNYFFEWLVWLSYFVFALASPFGYFTLYCPLLMLFFLFRVTGIPLTEEQAVRSKGDAYREYQQTTSAFVPWLKRAAR
jgi:steroid 5-alpha reductase family enzyme